MRELNPRAWIPSLNRYATGYDDLYYHRQMNGGGEWWVYPAGEDEQLDVVEIELPTGLKDKNGKEIYEGDIVDYNDDGECVGVVKYEAPEFYLDADATNWARMFLKGAPHQKVVGNIHENPELLEEKE